MKTFIIKLIIISGILLSFYKSFSQGKLVIKGDVKYEKNFLSDVTITIYKDGVKYKELKNENSGKFSIELEIGESIYIVEFSKPGYVKNKFEFNTEIKDPRLKEKNCDFKLYVDLFPYYEGVDLSVFDYCIGLIKFDPTEKEFLLDLDYTNSYINKIFAVKNEIETRKKNLEQYKIEIAKGDSLYDLNMLVEARNAYRTAQRLLPKEKYPKERIQEINKILAEIAAQKKYDGLIVQADNLFLSKQYIEAKNLYQQALETKPGETYPAEKIKQIDEIFAKANENQQLINNLLSEGDKLFAANQLEQALQKYEKASELNPLDQNIKNKIETTKTKINEIQNKEKYYKSVLASADSAYLTKNYELAINFYKKALLIKPSDPIPKNKINEINTLITEMKNKENSYKNYIAIADKQFSSNFYEKAKENYQNALNLKPEEEYPKKKIAEIDKILAERLAIEENYNKAINEGNYKLSQKDYAGAKIAFEQASSIKPKELLPKQKIAEIDKILSDLKVLEETYKKNIEDAELAYNRKDYEKALLLYQQANKIKPEESYPKTKISELTTIIAEEKNKTEKYNKIIADADQKLANKEFETALKLFEQALTIKPNETYPRDKINEINKFLSDEKTKNELYNKSIAEGDKYFSAGDLAMAKLSYQDALKIKPNETYPKTKIDEINNMLAEVKARNDAYNKAIAEADKFFNLKDYDKALAFYQKAKEAKPSETYPNEKINKINEIITEQKNKEENYKKAIAEADAAFQSKNYEEAKKQYELAINLKPNEQYPKKQLKTVNNLILAQKTKDEIYNKSINEGDAAFNASNYTLAKSHYQKALATKPNETYPSQKIAEIDKILAEIKARDDKYNAIITEADALLAQKKYNEAKTAYQNALTIKPNENYPQNKINEIETIIIENKNKEEAYNKAITDGNTAFQAKDYNLAKIFYQKALSIKPSEELPKQKISEIEKILAQLKAIDDSYNKCMAEGNIHYNNKNYEKALEFYKEALKLKPEELAAKSKVEELTLLITELKNKKAKYDNLINIAENYYKTNDYENAKNYYSQASEVFPEEKYPRDKIKEIDNLIAEIERKRKKEKYDKAISNGDQALLTNSYEQALKFYNEALEIMPDDAIAQNKINQVNTIIKENEIKRINKEYNEAIEEAEKLFANQQYDKALAAFRRASEIKPIELHPKNRINEINKILADKQKALDEAYNQAITDGDLLFNSANYLKARQAYMKAAELKPNEQYPKTKLQEIASQLEKNRTLYATTIAEADKFFTQQNYEKALELYKKCSSLLPDEEYPKTKISEISQILAEIKAKEEKFKKFITDGDRLFSMKKYNDAKNQYIQALELKNDDKYAQQQIEKINKILDAIDPYQNAIADADLYFKKGDYQKALIEYQKASKIKPEEKYPKDRINICNTKIEQKRILDKAYSDGYYVIHNEPIIIKSNNEKKFYFIPFEKRKNKSKLVLKIKNLSNQNINTILNFGIGETKNGGTYVDFLKSKDTKEYSVEISTQIKWKSTLNDWISLYPMGGDIQVESITIIFGDE